ncbi:MAG TPA: type II toxin-antitoxin system HicA family toxin [Blastocatellia bacterium]|nr:type II toxin-antitoxin system HicA family toxin [Blastocatellia bacterium]
MKPLPFREVKRKLEAAGFTEAGQTGSHVKFAKTTAAGTRSATVPKHHEVAAGTLRSILRQTGLNAEEFDAL